MLVINVRKLLQLSQVTLYLIRAHDIMYEQGEIPVFSSVPLSLTLQRSNTAKGATSFITLYSFETCGW